MRRLTLLLVLWHSAGSVHAQTVVSYPATVSAEESVLLERLVCLAPHGVQISSIQARTFDELALGPAAYAEVECAPHDSYAGVPLYSFAHCDQTENHWSCKDN